MVPEDKLSVLATNKLKAALSHPKTSCPKCTPTQSVTVK